MQQPLHIKTPVYQSQLVSDQAQKQVYLKMDALQPSGSFKIRGIGQLCQELAAAGQTHFVSSSGGNAGYSVAYAAKQLGAQATVLVPSNVFQIYISAIERMGAKVIVAGEVWDDAHNAALEYCDKVNGSYIPPFNHPTLWAGHSTIIDEAINQIPKPGAVITSVGGGGLACGLLAGMHHHGWDDVPLITVETLGAASFAKSIHAGKHLTLDKIETVAVTLGAKRVTEKLLWWSKRHRILPLVVEDAGAVLACHKFADDRRILVEPACGATLSILYDQHPVLEEFDSVLAIVCGGIGVNLELLLSRYRSA